MIEKQRMKDGVYLVIDPQMEKAVLINKLKEILDKSEIAAVQVWNNFKNVENQIFLINEICKICKAHGIPVLLNNNWKLLNQTEVNGVHFDEIPNDFREIKESIPSNTLLGLTCNNNLDSVKWAKTNKFDYISFCSIFPSSSANSCDLVDFEIIRKARKLTKMPIFLAGGIKPSNMHLLKELDFEGVAVISGIMSAENPSVSTENYNSEFKKIKNENFNNR
ncbi:thiamine phosphate synthase [Salegentibacter salegens]|uniref:Thiamine-phosphate pyrophosphorylase n=1 Tax=Salegentibacter salegens TaxID=143223 RepID=A0A1M7KY51_9FLAO|nr:thiamine phosphate synthase [Salegentibacter salegens]PRX41972.1 thiamine-phosphate pyrophosphorylase [Salegentibacter salegens]SHM70517.1 thiamine-phosphate pyrophosphorylase [Salegentibacter salegens]